MCSLSALGQETSTACSRPPSGVRFLRSIRRQPTMGRPGTLASAGAGSYLTRAFPGAGNTLRQESNQTASWEPPSFLPPGITGFGTHRGISMTPHAHLLRLGDQEADPPQLFIGRRFLTQTGQGLLRKALWRTQPTPSPPVSRFASFSMAGQNRIFSLSQNRT